MSKFWNAFEALCQKRSVTPTYVAGQCGIGKSTTTRWRKGSIPQKAQLELIAKYFGVSVDYLLGYENESSGNTGSSEANCQPKSTFWDRFRFLCFEKGTNPTSVAKELHISTGAPTSWKNGAVPFKSTIKKLAEYFGVTADYLVGEIDTTEKIVLGDPNKQELYDYVKDMSDDDAAFALQLLKKLIDGK